MITITKNINFSNWFDIRLWGELIDSQTNQAKAMKVAQQIQAKNTHLQIVNKVKSKWLQFFSCVFLSTSIIYNHEYIWYTLVSSALGSRSLHHAQRYNLKRRRPLWRRFKEMNSAIANQIKELHKQIMAINIQRIKAKRLNRISSASRLQDMQIHLDTKIQELEAMAQR